VGPKDEELVKDVIDSLNKKDKKDTYAYLIAKGNSGKQKLRTAVVFKNSRL
jgi:hypothetical protein